MFGINAFEGGIIWTGKEASMALCSHDHKQRSLPLSISNCILEFPQTHINARFLSHIDNFGLSPYDRYHLEILKNAGSLLTLRVSLRDYT